MRQLKVALAGYAWRGSLNLDRISKLIDNGTYISTDLPNLSEDHTLHKAWLNTFSPAALVKLKLDKEKADAKRSKSATTSSPE